MTNARARPVLAWCVSFFAAGACAAAPLRIVSLSPHITELLFAVGAGDYIVGTVEFSDFPAAAKTIPRVGDSAALDVERILQLRPTIVLLWKSGTPARQQAELKRLQLPVHGVEQRHLADIESGLMELGRLTGNDQSARNAASQLHASIATLRQRYRGRSRLRIFYQVWDRPLYTLAGGHMVNEVLDLCGGENLFAKLKGLAPVVDLEAVLSGDPDTILIGATGSEATRQIAEWDRMPSLRAVRLRHVYAVDPSLLNRMTPRIVAGIEAVCQALDRARQTH
jgi:iron complex transport system substrate-binding protein